MLLEDLMDLISEAKYLKKKIWEQHNNKYYDPTEDKERLKEIKKTKI